MERSKYGKYSYTRVPRRKRTIALEGVKEDTGKWFKCWNCGFPNNIDRNSVGDGSGAFSSGSGFGSGGFGGGGFGDEGFGDGGNEGAGGSINLETTGGCSFCGCMNYR